MGFMPGIFSRDKFFQRLDVLLNRHPKEVLQALRRVESGEDPNDRSVYQIAVDVDRALVPDNQEPDPNGRAIDATAIERVNAFWYTNDTSKLYYALDTTKYTPAVMRRISRLAFIRALEVANGERKLRTSYCCVGSHFEGVVNGMDPRDGVVQILLVTGALRDNLTVPNLPFNAKEDVWIAGLGERIAATLARTPPGSPIETDIVWEPDTDIVWADAGHTIGVIRPRREA